MRTILLTQDLGSLCVLHNGQSNFEAVEDFKLGLRNLSSKDTALLLAWSMLKLVMWKRNLITETFAFRVSRSNWIHILKVFNTKTDLENIGRRQGRVEEWTNKHELKWWRRKEDKIRWQFSVLLFWTRLHVRMEYAMKPVGKWTGGMGWYNITLNIAITNMWIHITVPTEVRLTESSVASYLKTVINY
jgi:hypothetical protein